MPSLYDATAIVGDVSSANFTTLYNASGLTVPNAGAGTVSGNLNVSGNLTVQGTSLLVGAVTVGSTLCTPNYCFPLPDGTTDQVMTTDGSGNLYWTSISTLGGNYTIQADTVSGGSNLTLVSSSGVLDSVKFASGSNVTVARTDASTITINATDTNTTYTQNASTATGGANLNLVGSDATTDTVKFASGTGITVSRTDADTITITNSSPAGVTYNIDASTTTGGANLNLTGSDASTDAVKFAGAGDTTVTRTDANTITITSTSGSSIPNGTSRGQVLYWDGSAWTADNVIAASASGSRLVSSYENSTAGVSSALFVRKDFGATSYATGDGPAISYTVDSNAQALASFGLTKFSYSATDPKFGIASSTNNFSTSTALLDLNKVTADIYAPNLSLNATQAGVPALDATITAVRGSSTDATISWLESTDAWTFSENIHGDKILDVAGVSIGVNSASTAADSFVYLKGTSQYVKWNNTLSQFELSDPLFITNTVTPATFERKKTTADAASESKSGIKIVQRVTNAGSNATNDGGVNIMFARTSGASGGAEVKYGALQFDYYGASNTAEYKVLWSDDDFTETTPGVYPGTYPLQKWNTTRSVFFNNSLYVDYTTLGSTQVGINMATPAYTLDVAGDINLTGSLYFNGTELQISSPQAGQLITYDGTKFLNTATVSWTSNTYRTLFQGNSGVAGRAQAASAFVNNTGATNYGQGDGSGVLMGVNSTAQGLYYAGSSIMEYDTGGDHLYRVTSSTNSFASITATSITGTNTLVFGSAHGLSAGQRILYTTTTQNGLTQSTYYYVLATGLTTTQCRLSLTSGGTALVLTNGTGLSLNFQTASTRLVAMNQTMFDVTSPELTLNAIGYGTASVDASIVVERGTSGADVSVKWNSSTNRWTTTTDGSAFLNIPDQNLDQTSDVEFNSIVLNNQVGIAAPTGTTTTSVSTVAISATTRNVLKLVIYIVDNTTSAVHTVEALALRTGATAMLTTYGEMYSASALAAFTADVSGGSLRILVTPASTNNTTFTYYRISLT
jgi:hypothetical protein